MNKTHQVLVYWSEEKLNRLPISGQYITVARFREDEALWPSEAWSVVLQIQGNARSQPCKAEARFLSPNAPEERFRSGVQFELIEGNRTTAIVHVV
ncbi:hypothetical protein [Pseudoxanthomonas sangjuensis]|uniref:hypothetical protein n=1 Tax=Pseudoxanthomonas sangjuensis TaxID=1503750 RepID=UPI0013906F5C|nr:hypothetical protein [Pseudoxanthomonas sangjuensis]